MTVERIAASRRKFLSAIGPGKMPLITMRQFHSDVIHVSVEPSADSPKADALITRTPGLLLGVQTADCVPILLQIRDSACCGGHSCWWRGTLARIAVKTLGAK